MILSDKLGNNFEDLVEALEGADSDKAGSGYWYVSSPYTNYDAKETDILMGECRATDAEGEVTTGYSGGRNRAAAEVSSFTGKLWDCGLSSYSPIAHAHQIKGNIDLSGFDADAIHNFYMGMHEPMMAAAGGVIVLMLGGWANSLGVNEEIDYFCKSGKPAFFVRPDGTVSHWQMNAYEEFTISRHGTTIDWGDYEFDRDAPQEDGEMEFAFGSQVNKADGNGVNKADGNGDTVSPLCGCGCGEPIDFDAELKAGEDFRRNTAEVFGDTFAPVLAGSAPRNAKDIDADTKLPLQFIPPVAIAEAAKAMAVGVAKHGKAYNWRDKPVSLMNYIGAIQRHTAALLQDEWLDPEGQTHLGAIIAAAAILLDAENEDMMIDDVPASSSNGDIFRIRVNVKPALH